MKSIIRKETYEAIYKFLDDVTPIPQDCGLLCGAACCTCSDEADGQDMGIYLLPGEDKLFSGKEDWLKWSADQADSYDFPDSWHGKVYFIRCLNAPKCPREKRPLQCRFFPLAPHLTENDKLQLILYFNELPYRCPLIAEKKDLQTNFIRAVFAAWKKLMEDPLIYDLVELDSSFRSQDSVTVVYTEENFISLTDSYSSFVME